MIRCPHCSPIGIRLMIVDAEDYIVEPNGSIDPIDGSQNIYSTNIRCDECDTNLDEHFRYNSHQHLVKAIASTQRET